MSKRVKVVVGTRPQIIKLASLVKAFDSERLEFSIVHTGQHYDFEMDQIFFEELGLPKPEAHLGVGSGSHAWQTGTTLIRLEKALDDANIVIVPGDTNSALAGGLAAVKMGIRLGHLEAGLRSYQPFMPEEVNRVLVDHMSQLLFAPTTTGYENLIREGITKDKIHLTGDVMADNIQMLEDRIRKTELPMDLTKGDFAYATIHRAENVDHPENLRSIVETLLGFHDKYGLEVIFPLHPHTKKSLEKLNLVDVLSAAQNIHVAKPVSYLTSLRLARDARIVLTDSGGLQKEAFILGTPVVTIRDATEWVETVDAGWNKITGPVPSEIGEAVNEFLEKEPERVDPMKFYGEGKASRTVARIIKEQVG